MKKVKVYYVKDLRTTKGKRFLSPFESRKAKREMKAVMELAGLWENKDTSFFDKR